VGGGGVGWNVPAGELGEAGVVDAEVDFGEGEMDGGGGGGDGARGMEDELPLGVGEEDADRGVGAEEGSEDDDGQGFEHPADFDEGDHLGGSGAALGVVAGLEAGRRLGLVCGGFRHLADGLRISHLGGVKTWERGTGEKALNSLPPWASSGSFGCAIRRSANGYAQDDRFSKGNRVSKADNRLSSWDDRVCGLEWKRYE